MLDSITASFTATPSPSQLASWGCHIEKYPTTPIAVVYDQWTQMENGAVVRFRYYPPNPPAFPEPHLRVTASLPKVIFGENTSLVIDKTQLAEAVDRLDQFLEQIPWLPKICYGSGLLSRLDVACNHQVGETVQEYVKYLSRLPYPERSTEPYLYEGVQFRSKAVTTKFYDKYVECQHEAARGILRQEITYRYPYYIERRMGIPSPKIFDIHFSWLHHTLETDLKKLRLTDCVITDRFTAQEKLIRHWGWEQGNVLFAHLVAMQGFSREQMVALGAKSDTLRKRDSAIEKAGVAQVLTSDVTLPALRIGDVLACT